MTGLPSATSRRPDGAAFFIAALLAAIGGLLIWQGRGIPDKGGYAGIGSGDMPVFVGAVLIVLALCHVIKGLRQMASPIPQQQRLPVLLIVGGLIVQLVLLQPLGFSIASGLLFAATAAAFGKRNLLVSVPVGIALGLVVYGTFDRLLRLNLPGGMLENLIFGG